MCHSLTVFDHN